MCVEAVCVISSQNIELLNNYKTLDYRTMVFMCQKSDDENYAAYKVLTFATNMYWCLYNPFRFRWIMTFADYLVVLAMLMITSRYVIVKQAITIVYLV